MSDELVIVCGKKAYQKLEHEFMKNMRKDILPPSAGFLPMKHNGFKVYYFAGLQDDYEQKMTIAEATQLEASLKAPLKRIAT